MGEPIQLNCPVPNCGWKSQSLPIELASALNTALNLHAQTEHPPPSQPSHGPSLKIKPPSISANSTPDQWSSFKKQWAMYKTGMAIGPSLITTALFHCCDEDLMNDLMRDLQADVTAMSETDLLAAIHRLAVKEESTLVHRIRLSRMTQAPGTPIRTFLATLKGQAALCKYTVKCKEPNCTHEYDYSSEIIKDNLIRGIADPEILSDVLGDSKTDRTLEQTVDFIAQKEHGKSTRAAMGDSASAMTQSRSNKPRQNSQQTPGKDQMDAKCWACEEPRHGKLNDRNTRSKYCKAWTNTCEKCSVKGHWARCCSKCAVCNTWGHRDKSSPWCSLNPRARNKGKKNSAEALNTEDDETSAVNNQLCAVENQTNSEYSTKPVEHHVYEGKWVARPSKPHPVLSVRFTPLPEDHARLGHPMKSSNPTPVEIPMIADTGCQSNIVPLRTALAMGIARCDIFPVSLSMRGAITEDMGRGVIWPCWGGQLPPPRNWLGMIERLWRRRRRLHKRGS